MSVMGSSRKPQRPASPRPSYHFLKTTPTLTSPHRNPPRPSPPPSLRAQAHPPPLEPLTSDPNPACSPPCCGPVSAPFPHICSRSPPRPARCPRPPGQIRSLDLVAAVQNMWQWISAAHSVVHSFIEYLVGVRSQESGLRTMTHLPGKLTSMAPLPRASLRTKVYRAPNSLTRTEPVLSPI